MVTTLYINKMSRSVDFTYKYEEIDGTAKELRYSVEIPYRDDVKELSHRILATEMPPLRRYLELDSGE